MDKLKELWVKMDQEDSLEQMTDKSIAASIRAKSTSVTAELQMKLLIKMWFCAIFSVVIIVTITFIPVMIVKGLLSVVLLAYLISALLIFRAYKILKKHPEADNNLLIYLKSHLLTIKKVLRYEALFTLILFPISATAGFLFGMYLFEPNTGFLDESRDWTILITTLVICIPLAHFLGKWMNHIAFGSNIHDLQSQIEEMEMEK
jgi:O-antigen ligase